MVEDRLSAGSGSKPLIVFGQDYKVAHWVSNQLGSDGFGPIGSYVALGAVVGNDLIGGVVYHNLRGKTIEVSLATTSPKWANRTTLKIFCKYPFIQLDCKRVTALVDTTNKQCRDFVERMGFVHEGTLREAHPSGDAEVYGLLKTECRWL